MNSGEILKLKGKSEEVITFFTQLSTIGSYGVVFKGLKKDLNDLDDNGKRKQYAIKRIFPTINAAFILIEMLILKLLK
jgi:hypothetical protein